MKTITIFKLVIWVICFLFTYDAGLQLITQPNTIENILGVLILTIVGIISIKTKAFTNIKLKNKHGK